MICKKYFKLISKIYSWIYHKMLKLRFVKLERSIF